MEVALEKGADIHATKDYSLRKSASNGYTDMVKLLLDRGANVHIINDDPLKNAIENGHTETAELIKKYMEKK